MGMARAASWGVLAATAALVAACAAPGPPPPLLIPLSEGGSYGYSENRLAPDRYEITYRGPYYDVPLGGAQRRQSLDRIRAEARDIALWRSAELALERGFAAVRVDSSRSDLEVETHTFAYSPLHHHGRHFHHHAFRPYFGPYYDYPRSTAQARVRLKVTLLKQPTAGALDAAATARRYRARYGQPVPGTKPPPE